MALTLVTGFWPSSWRPETLPWGTVALLFALGAYLSVMSHVLVHNAAHNNLPYALNLWVGEIGGLIVATRFAAWDILHQRHHAHPDDAERDPHPVERSFIGFVVRKMIFNLEPNIQQQYFELHGKTKARVLQAQLRTLLGVITTAALLAFWWRILGTQLFVFVYVPATALAALYVAHFNWVTHGGPTGQPEIKDLDHGYYWFANRILFGLYLHATHHEHPQAFNPLRVRT